MSLADVTDPRFTAEQRATLAAFESAPTPPEVREAAVVEEVARALWDSIITKWDVEDWAEQGAELQAEYRRLAAAAVAAYRAQDGGAEA